MTFFSLRGWGKHKSGVLTTEQVYIHGKTCIIDDRKFLSFHSLRSRLWIERKVANFQDLFSVDLPTSTSEVSEVIGTRNY
jgi:hypothetical protein